MMQHGQLPVWVAYLFTLAHVSHKSLDCILLLVKLHSQAVNLLQVLCALRLQACAQVQAVDNSSAAEE